MTTSQSTLNAAKRRPFARVLLAMVTLLVSAAPASKPAIAVDGVSVLTKVVEHGDPAPGLGEGLVIAGFGTHPQLKLVFGAGDVPARIDRQGNVTFHAFGTPNGQPGECPLGDLSLCPPAGLFRTLDNRLELIVAVGDDAPGTGLAFAGFPAVIPITPRISDGRVAILGEVGENVFADGQVGVWSDRFGELDLLVLEQDTVLPGMPRDGQVTRPFFFELEGDRVFFFGGFDTDQLPADFRPQGLWRNVSGEFEPIGVAGTPAPGFPVGVVFGDTDTLNILGTFGTFDTGDAGRVAFTAFVRGPGIEVRSDEAIWVETDKGFELLLREDTLVPPGPFAPGSTFSNGNVIEGAFLNGVSPPIRINNDGNVVFFAQIDVPGDPPRVPTLWSNRNGALELVFRGRQRGVAFSEPGDEAPGIPAGHFFFPDFVDIDDSGHIVVRAFVETNNDLFDSTIGIWVDRGFGFEPVAFEEGPVPGMPGVTFLPRSRRGVGDFVLESDGTIVYSGRFLLQGVTTVGLFRHPPASPAQMLLRTGGEVDIGGTGNDIRVVSNFRPGVGTSDEGAKTVEVFFTDGSAGLYTIDVTPDGPRPGDVDGDGIVGITDFLLLLAAWGPCAECASCSADFDDDCNVGITDLLTLLGNWG